MSKKFVLDFVNKGKSFSMPIWTVEKHEQLLSDMSEHDELMKESPDKYERIYRKALILKSLHEVDDSVTEKDLDDLHPEDFVDLFTAVYLCGRKGITKDFREENKKSNKTP